jgi:hypothetical protein
MPRRRRQSHSEWLIPAELINANTTIEMMGNEAQAERGNQITKVKPGFGKKSYLVRPCRYSRGRIGLRFKFPHLPTLSDDPSRDNHQDFGMLPDRLGEQGRKLYNRRHQLCRQHLQSKTSLGKKWSSAYAVCRFFFKDQKWPKPR